MKNIIIAGVISFIFSCKSKELEVKPQKQDTVSVDIKQPNYVWKDNVYTNNVYRFKVEFPKNWEYDNGAHENTLARAGDKKYGFSASVQVIKLPADVKNSDDIFNSLTKEEMKESMEIEISNTILKSVKEIKVEKGFVSNINAYICSFFHTVSSGTRSVEMSTMQIRCFRNGNMIQLSYSAPKSNLKEATQFFNRTTDSFLFF